MKTKPRFLLLISLLLMVSSVFGTLVIRQLSLDLVQEWSERYLEKQMLYDRARSLTPVIEETEKLLQLADDPQLLAWAADPENLAKFDRAQPILEAARQDFAAQNLFIALDINRNYYYQQERIDRAFLEPVYQLNPNFVSDLWFFSAMINPRMISPHVSYERGLNKVNLRFNAPLSSEGQVIGLIGTGIDLSNFIGGFLRSQEPGIETFFTDRDGAVRLGADRTLIDFSPQGKTSQQKTLIFDQLTSAHTRTQLEGAFERAEANPMGVITDQLDWNGQVSAVGVSYIPELEWYEITVIDLNRMVPSERFMLFYLTLLITLILTLIALYIGLSKYVTSPLETLKRLIDQIQSGDLEYRADQKRLPGEFHELELHLVHAASHIREYQESLEEKVLERTAELQHLSQHDPLTGLLNRRGLNERLEQHFARWQRDGSGFSLIWIDVDKFKTLNDELGHQSGDRALKTIANHIKQVIRTYDHGARWGGDEFMVLLESTDADQMEIIAKRLLNVPKVYLGDEQPVLTQLGLSIGGATIQPGDTLNTLLIRADEALYQAKEAGRGRYVSGKLT